MTNYVGQKCPVCGKTFTEDDDIVVCPQCGAPYHRSCYERVGKCIFESKHGTAEAWTPQKLETDSEKTAGDRTKRCPRCGYMNSENARFCEHCGLPLSDSRPQEGTPPGGHWNQNGNNPPQRGNYPPPGNTPPPGNYPPPGPIPFTTDPLGGVNPNERIDEIPAGEMAKFVQGNSQYYLPVFMNLKRFGKNRFNFCAFLFPGPWMLYRKLYKAGTIVTSIMFALYIVSAYVSQQFLLPIYEALYQKIGISLETTAPTYEQIQKMVDILYTMPFHTVLLMSVPTIILIIQLVLMLVFGFRGNRMYLKHCIAHVGQIGRTAVNSSEAEGRLQEEGGANVLLAVSMGICYLILSYITGLF